MFSREELRLIVQAISGARWGVQRGEFARLYQKVSAILEEQRGS